MNEAAPELMEKVETLATLLGANGWRLATAESCTGGLVGAALTAVPGSSAWYKGGVVAYANEVKQQVLQVPRTALEEHGAVSVETVRAMAEGVCKLLDVEAGLAVSGIAGPGGGSEDKPVGTVWICARVQDVSVEEICRFTGERADIRGLSVVMALDMLTALAQRLAMGEGG